MASAHRCVGGLLPPARERPAAISHLQDVCAELRRPDQSAQVCRVGIDGSNRMCRYAQYPRTFLASFLPPAPSTRLLTTPCLVSDDKERLAFLTSLASKLDKPESQDAYVYALADVADAKLRLPDLDGAQKDLASCQRVLDTFDSVETVVHASFYKVNADYYHVSVQSANSTPVEIPGEKHHSIAETDIMQSPSKNSPPSTKMPSSTWPASTSKSSRRANVSPAPTTSALPPSSPTRSTTSASSCCTRSWTP